MIAEKDFAGRQSRGKRKRQEDTYAFSEISGEGDRVEGLFVVVADGMGGHTAGGEASQVALENFMDAFHLSTGSPGLRFRSSMVAANEAITREWKNAPGREGMGTTLLAVAVTSLGVEWISVGDSPLYLWRAGALTRLNEDHSFRPMLLDMVQAGHIEADVAAKHPLKNILRAALTGREIEMLDQSSHPVELLGGDIVVVATDGIQTLHDDDIADVISECAHSDASVIAAKVLQAVEDIDYAKQDNITVAIIKAGKGGFVARQTADKPEKRGSKKTSAKRP